MLRHCYVTDVSATSSPAEAEAPRTGYNHTEPCVFHRTKCDVAVFSRSIKDPSELNATSLAAKMFYTLPDVDMIATFWPYVVTCVVTVLGSPNKYNGPLVFMNRYRARYGTGPAARCSPPSTLMGCWRTKSNQQLISTMLLQLC